MCFDKFISIVLFVICCQSLVVDYHYDEGIRPFKYQTFSGYSMDYNQGRSYINFDLTLKRDITETGPVFIELIVIPDININDIGIKQDGNLHLCCRPEFFGKYGCSEEHIGELIIPKTFYGLYRDKIAFYHNVATFNKNVSVKVTGMHVFALATCDSHLQLESGVETLITFNGTANWVGITNWVENKNEIVQTTIIGLMSLFHLTWLFIIILIGFFVVICTCKNKHKVEDTNTIGETKSLDMDEYYKKSAEECFCNKSCSCCTCRCCAFFVLTMWIIFGIYGAISSYQWIELFSDEWKTTDPCSVDNINNNIHGPCCMGYMPISGVELGLSGTCEHLSDVYTIGLVQSIICCLTGVAGTIGLIILIHWLLLIPLGYSFLSVILSIITVVLLGVPYMAFSWSIIYSVALAMLIAVLFYRNWKIMKETVRRDERYSQVSTTIQ